MTQEDLYEDLDSLAEVCKQSGEDSEAATLTRVLEALVPYTETRPERETVRRWLRDQARPHEQKMPVSMYTNEFTGETWFE